MRPPVVEVRDLRFQYDDGTRALNGVNFRLDAGESVARFLDHARHLGATLGQILYQLPPRWHANAERLAAFLVLLPRDLAHVFEFRDRSWMSEEILALLDGAGAGFCVHDMAGLATERWASGRIAYVRFHGAGGKYAGRYEPAALADWARWMRAQEAEGRTVWGYFNNDIDAHAIADALAMKALIGPSP